SVNHYEFTPTGRNEPTHMGKAVFENDRYPEDRTERDIELHVAAANRQHQRNFMEAIAKRARPVADIEEGHISSASCILANLSMQLGRTLAWNPERHEVTNDAEATRLLRRPYRQPWVHPEPRA